MLPRFVRARAALALVPILAAAACKDQTPTLSGDESFPGGSRPVTLELIVPAAQFMQPVGVFQGFESAATFDALVVANQYQGVTSAHVLQRYNIPDTLSYSQDGSSRTDTAFSIRNARFVIAVDSTASLHTGTTTLRANRLAQHFDASTVTWDVAVDTAGEHTPWTVPGGTPGALLGTGTYNHAVNDTIVVPIDSAAARGMLPDTAAGVLFTTAEANTRLQLSKMVLRVDLKPSNAVRDTTITIEVSADPGRFVFTPDPPLAPVGTAWSAGGILAARTLFTVNLDQPLPGCKPPQTCAAVRLKDVELNRVSLLLRPVASPTGFDLLEPAPITLWTVDNPELGGRAPLGHLAIDPDSTGLSGSQFATYTPGDTLVELKLTGQTLDAVNRDTLQLSFALLGETPPVGGVTGRTFGVPRFDPLPRLRFVYTLHTRPELP
jgi:opacity protein-like surface antigen